MEQELNNKPNIEFKDIGLSVNAQNVPINTSNSIVKINGNEYFSREIVENLIPENKNFTIENKTLLISYTLPELPDIDSIKSENSNLKKEIGDLENKIVQHQNKETNLQDKINNLQNELDEYIIKYGIISGNNFETTSIFTLETFQGAEFWRNSSDISNSKSLSSNDFIDTYGNEYPESNLADHYHLNKNNEHAPTYLLDYNYSKCEGKIAWPKSKKNVGGYVWIEFYSDDKLIYQTEPMYASDRALDFEFSVNDVEKLTVVKKSTREAGLINIIYPYFNLVK